MSNNRSLHGSLAAAAFLVAASSLATSSHAFQGSRDPFRPASSNAVQAPDFEGYGSGWIALPRLALDGEMVGKLVNDADGSCFQLEALLTGCIPVSSDGHYWFGGVYGSIDKAGAGTGGLGDVSDPWLVEGTWHVNKYGHGSIRARVIRVVPGRGLGIVGILRCKFIVREGSLLFTSGDLDDASSSATPPKSPYGGVASPKKHVDPYGDAASVPRKDKHGKSRYSDAASKDRTNPYGDAGSYTWPRPEGQFGLYFRF